MQRESSNKVLINDKLVISTVGQNEKQTTYRDEERNNLQLVFVIWTRREQLILFIVS
jgi:hypothetical protein